MTVVSLMLREVGARAAELLLEIVEEPPRWGVGAAIAS
jgi:hypothetical protein